MEKDTSASVYADNVNRLGDNINGSSSDRYSNMEVGLEVNTQKTKHM
jgi:hypothetical protein